MSQIKGGVALNYLTVILTNVLGLIITPLMIRKMGTAEYGLYALIGAFVGYLTLFDFGLNTTVVRFVAKYKSMNDKKKEGAFIGTTFIIYLMLSAVLVLMGLGIYLNLHLFFSVSLSPEELEKAKLMFLILLFNVAITLPGSIFQGIAFGYQKFIFPKAVRVIKYVMRAVMIVVLLEYGYKALGIVILDTVMNFLLLSANGYYVIAKMKIPFRVTSFNKHMMKGIFGFSVWIFVYALVSQIQWKTGQVMLGIQFDTATVAIFAVGVTLGGYYGAFSMAISNVFLPRAAHMTVNNASPEVLTNMMIKVGRISLLVLAYVFIAFTLFGRQFVNLWVGEEYQISWVIAVIIMIAYTVPLVQAFGNSVLEAKNKIAFKAILYLVFLSIGTVVGAVLALEYKEVGMIVGIAGAWIIAQNILNWYYQKKIGLNIFRFFKELLHKILPVTLLIAAVGYGIHYFIPGTGWINFLLKAALYSIVYFGLIFRFGMNTSEKAMLLGILQKTGSFLGNKNSK